jgi:hypothetical protein
MCIEPIGPELEAELLGLIAEGRTVAAIKKLREATGIQLHLCKKWVDDRIAEMVSRLKNPTSPK